MNTKNNSELAEVAKTQSAVDAMAVVTLSPEKYAAEVYQPFTAKLTAAIDSVRAIDYDIKTTAGMSVAIKARALFRDLRIDADKERKARKEPITKIGKLLESGFDQVEERITPLEKLFDADIEAENMRKEAEKAAKILAERQRTEAIEARIQAIRNAPLAAIGKSSADILAARDAVRDTIITEELFGEQSYRDKAMDVRSEAFNALEAAFDVAEKAEAAARAAEQARLAEAARIEQERAELARQRIEAEHVANEQAAERKRLADLAAAQERAAAELRAKAEANLRAEREAQEEAMRAERQKAMAVQAEKDRQLAAQQAAIDAQAHALAEQQAAADARDRAALAAAQDAQRREDDHPVALVMNAQFDLERLQTIADQHLADSRTPATMEELVAAASDEYELHPTDREILDNHIEAFGGTEVQAVARLMRFADDVRLPVGVVV
jgi:hypothetical protein